MRPSQPSDRAPGDSGYVLVTLHVREKENRMKRYDYKIHYQKLETGTPNEQQLLDTLNQFGSEGWRLNRLYGEVSLRSLASWKGGFNLLLEREITE